MIQLMNQLTSTVNEDPMKLYLFSFFTHSSASSVLLICYREGKKEYQKMDKIKMLELL